MEESRSFLDLFNQTMENPEILEKISSDDGAFVVGSKKSNRGPEEVKYSYYKQQKYYRRNDHGESSFFLAWTLFVVWMDDTMDCWVNALDVSKGVGYLKEKVTDTIKPFLSGEDRIVKWEQISKYIYENLSPLEEDLERGYEAAGKNLQRTPFLTEEGLYEVYQFSPKCKSFRRSVANLLRYIRQHVGAKLELTASQMKSLVANETESVRQRLEAEKRAELATVREEYDRRVDEMKRSIAELQVDMDRLVRERAVLRTELDSSSQELIRSRVQMSKLGEEMAVLRDNKEKLMETLNENKDELCRVNNELRSMTVELIEIGTEKRMLVAQVDEKKKELKGFTEAFNVVSKIYTNPRNVSLVDGFFPIAKEPCVFLNHFGQLLLENGEWRDGLCILRRQRGGLAQEARNIFVRRASDNGYWMNDQYRSIGILSRLQANSVIRVDEYSMPNNYQPSSFLYPECDSLLNDHDRFMLLNASNAVSFVNMLIDENWATTTPTEDRPVMTRIGYDVVDGGSSARDDHDKERRQRLEKLHRRYKRKRGEDDDGYVEPLTNSTADVDDCREENDKAKYTRNLIKRIVAREPDLRLALTLKRYTYRPVVTENNSTNKKATMATVFYSTIPGVTGRQIKNAIVLLWKELQFTIEEQGQEKAQKLLADLIRRVTLEKLSSSSTSMDVDLDADDDDDDDDDEAEMR